MDKAEILTRLAKVQAKINVPKDLYNKFGGYHYRNAETIMAAATPLLTAEGLTMTVKDDIVEVGSRIYVLAFVFINDIEVGHAAAREAETKKGMDESQITGAASSYARKYALNGVFLLDDVKDADHDSNHADAKPAEKPPAAAKTASKPKPSPTPAKTTQGNSGGSEQWRAWTVPFGKIKGKTLGELADESRLDELESLCNWMEEKFDPQSNFADKNRQAIGYIKEAIAFLETNQAPPSDEVEADVEF